MSDLKVGDLVDVQFWSSSQQEGVFKTALERGVISDIDDYGILSVTIDGINDEDVTKITYDDIVKENKERQGEARK